MTYHSSSATCGKVLCFGYGYVAQYFAHLLASDGWEVVGTSRTARQGVFRFDAQTPLSPQAWEGVTHVLHSIPPDERGDIVLRYYRQVLPHLQWVGYLSATSVYGDTQGNWVDETAPTDAPTERGRRRAGAERAWLSLGEETGVPVHIFRLAGIYGPGRNAIADVMAGQARRIFKPGQVFSRIHLEDITQVLLASMARPHAGAIYNLADDLPAPAWEVVEYASLLLGVEPPPLIPYEEADLSPMARSFYEASRRVSNRKIKEALGVNLRYPDYKAGLQALLEAEM